MLPSVRPVMDSMSAGVSTCRWRIDDLKFGANRVTAFTTASPKASRLLASQPPLMFDGAYCTKIDITCLPGGAICGSIIEGMMMSMYGSREKLPYFASSYAVSTYSIDGLMEIAPR